MVSIELSQILREHYLYKIAHNGSVPLVELKFGSSSGVFVLASDPALGALKTNDRIKFSEPLEISTGSNLRSTIRCILQVYRWEPVWTLIDTGRRQAWNRNEH